MQSIRSDKENLNVGQFDLPEADCDHDDVDLGGDQGGITCGAIDEPRKSSKPIDERVIINFRDMS